ncbi:MAG: hypothetical protein IPK32_15795 [Verrucomicrobiaceae bacterium]|nr:hypothetical protein [Verrucomicrobiaceae bacterium]
MHNIVHGHDCTLPCPWVGTEHCLLHMLREDVLHGGKLSYGQLSGLRETYYPHNLPLCVCPGGYLRWRTGAPVPMVDAASHNWVDDGPGL